jgi:hypothetical protein
MATSAQLTANRLNAQQSTGPQTAEGKAKVSQNRVSHGLTAAHVILPGEDAAGYENLLTSISSEFKPATPTEIFLVEQIAHCQWKLTRLAAMEADLFTRQMTAGPSLDAAAVFEQEANKLLKLQRYENAIRRAYFKALGELRAIQKPRRERDFEQEVDKGVARFIEDYINAPPPSMMRARLESRNYETKPKVRPPQPPKPSDAELALRL